MSPMPGRSTLMTSAPRYARSCVQVGPDCTWVKSRIFTPASALPACPHGLVLGRGRPLPDDFAGPFLAFRLMTFFDDFFADTLALAALDFAFATFLRFAIVSSPRIRCCVASADDLFLPQHALRVEIADTAALAAGRRIDRGIDQRRLAGIHRGLDGAVELVRRRGIGAAPAERLDHLVVARALDKDRGRRIGAAAAVEVGAAIDAVIIEDHDTDRQVVAADGFDLHAGKTEGAVALDRKYR